MSMKNIALVFKAKLWKLEYPDFFFKKKLFFSDMDDFLLFAIRVFNPFRQN